MKCSTHFVVCAFGCLKCGLKWVLCPFFRRTKHAAVSTTVSSLTFCEIPQPSAAREQEVCPETNPEGLPEAWEVKVCLINVVTKRDIPLVLGALLFLYLVNFFPSEIAAWASPLESVRWSSFSHKRTWRNLQVHTGVSAHLIGCTWKEKLVIVQDSCWSVHLQDKPSFLRQGWRCLLAASMEKKVKGEWPYRCSPFTPVSVK